MKMSAILKKEFLVFFRNAGLVIFILYAFTMDIYIAGGGIKVTPKNVSIGYVNEADNLIVNKIISSFHSPEFKKPEMFLNEKALKDAIYNKKIMVGIVFDKNFVNNLLSGKTAKLQVLIDSTAAAQAEVTLIYLQNILMKFNKNVKVPAKIDIIKLFNPNSNTKWFMSLSELMSVITMLGLVLIAVVFVREKENGTWDIMLLMPVKSSLIIFSKILSQVLILMAGITISVGLVVFGAFDAPINGNLLDFYLISFLYAFAIGGIALVIAAVSKNVLEVGHLTIVIMLPLIFLSGAWTPLSSMHPFIQFLSYFSPLRYYIQATQDIFFRGSAFLDLIPYFGAELLMSLVLFYIGYKKIGRLF